MNAAGRPASWKWWVSGVLLAASAINYMDRQALAGASVRITEELELSEEEYGDLELAFGWAFAAGSLVFGVISDRAPVRWLYPAVLLLWSAAGFATGLVRDHGDLLVCRTFLGFFEAGHWPCALRTTQRLLEARDRPMGNSVLQSGTSIGAIAILLVFLALPLGTESWRLAFQATGLAGLAWIAAWLLLVRGGDLEGAETAQAAEERGSPAAGGAGFFRAIAGRKMLAILIVVVLINTTWQIIRAWLPKFLQSGRGMGEDPMLLVNIGFYIASDLGCLGAGILTLRLQRRGATVHDARSRAFFAAALLCALALVAASLLPLGWPLLLMVLLAGAGALGVFPVYYSLTQDISFRHVGKVTGIASVAAWAFSSPAQKLYGRLVDETGSYDLGFAVAGCLPLAAFAVLRLLWGRSEPAPAPAEEANR